MGRRLTSGSRVLLCVAALCGGTAFFMVRGYVAQIAAADPGRRVAVIAASRDLAPGQRLEPSNTEVVGVPEAFVPPGALTEGDPTTGMSTRIEVRAGEVLTDARVGFGGPVAVLVPEGLRAMTLATSLPPEAVRAGDRVDVMATYTQGNPYTEVVGAGLEVLDVLAPADAGYATDAPRGPTIVVLVDPAGAQRLARALAFARLDFAVVGAREGSVVPMTSPSP